MSEARSEQPDSEPTRLRRHTAPAAVLATLAVTLPLAASPAGGAVTLRSASPAISNGPARGETLARCVSEAARQFAGAHAPAALAPEPTASVPATEPQPAPAVRPQLSPAHPLVPALPGLLDLPPPQR